MFGVLERSMMPARLFFHRREVFHHGLFRENLSMMGGKALLKVGSNLWIRAPFIR
jgi:hypothetical protein